MLRKSLLIFVLLGVCLAQTPSLPTTEPAISAYYALPGATTFQYLWLWIDPPLTINVDASGNPHLGITQAPRLDPLPVMYQVAPPTGPGACVNPVTGTSYDSSVIAEDAARLYFCVPNPAAAGSWIWASVPYATMW